MSSFPREPHRISFHAHSFHEHISQAGVLVIKSDSDLSYETERIPPSRRLVIGPGIPCSRRGLYPRPPRQRCMHFAPATQISPPLSLASRPLPHSAVHTLEEAVPLCQSVQRIVTLPLRADETAQRVDVVVSGNGTAVIRDLCDRNLDSSVILRLDNPVRSATFSRDVAVVELASMSE